MYNEDLIQMLFVESLVWKISLKKPFLKKHGPNSFLLLESCMVLLSSSWCPKVLKGRYLEKNATRLILESDLGSWDVADLFAVRKRGVSWGKETSMLEVSEDGFKANVTGSSWTRCWKNVGTPSKKKRV